MEGTVIRGGWINNKNGKVYEVMCSGIYNATNANEGQNMVLCTNEKGDRFVRESTEFLNKFTKKK